MYYIDHRGGETFSNGRLLAVSLHRSLSVSVGCAGFGLLRLKQMLVIMMLYRIVAIS